RGGPFRRRGGPRGNRRRHRRRGRQRGGSRDPRGRGRRHRHPLRRLTATGLGRGRMLPVAELHVHIEGTLEPELLIKLAARNGTPIPILDAAGLRAKYHFGDLQSFLSLYYANLRVLKIETDFYDLAGAYLTRAAAAGVRRA